MYNRDNYLKNKQDISEKSMKWYDKNKEQVLDRIKEYNQQNKEKSQNISNNIIKQIKNAFCKM